MKYAFLSNLTSTDYFSEEKGEDEVGGVVEEWGSGFLGDGEGLFLVVLQELDLEGCRQVVILILILQVCIPFI